MKCVEWGWGGVGVGVGVGVLIFTLHKAVSHTTFQ